RKAHRTWRQTLRRKLATRRLNHGPAERFAVMVRHANDPILLLDRPGRILEANERALAVYGYSLAELQALPPGDLGPVSRPDGRNADDSAMFVTSHRCKDGTLLPVEVRISACEIDGHPRSVLVCRDLTARKRTEAITRENNDFYRTTFEAAGLGIALIDTEGRPVRTNPMFQRILGYSEDELTRMVFTEFTHPDDRDRDWKIYEGLARGGRDWYNHEKRYIRKDGSTVFAAVTVSLVRDARNQPLFAVGILQDVTTRKAAEEYHALLTGVVESSEDAIVGKALDGVIQTWNRGAEKLFGYNRREAIGQPMAIIFPPDRVEEEHIILARIALGETVSHLKAARRRKNGELIDVSVTVSPIRDSSGAIIGASSCARGIAIQENVARQA
ncbi:MAG TPA: PAS domain S-box protein, partial [Candidatus Didemnitutus sp.]|nr:PAS domain S-box protein [Candidatus Didemnitutus sp.]